MERHDLAADPAHAETRRELEAALAAAQQQFDDPAMQRRSSRPPNVVVVFIDDLGYGDIGPFGAVKA